MYLPIQTGYSDNYVGISEVRSLSTSSKDPFHSACRSISSVELVDVEREVVNDLPMASSLMVFEFVWVKCYEE